MRIVHTARRGLTAALAAGVLAANLLPAGAQPPGGGGIPPEMQAKIKKWQKWREQNKDVSAFSDLLFQVQEMNKAEEFALDKKQSAKLLSLVKPWRTKKVMSNDEAKGLSKQISGMMTTKQLKKMATIETPSQRMQRGGGRPGGGGPGGPRPGGGPGGPRAGGGGPGGGMSFPDPPSGGWNPLNADTAPFEQVRPMIKKRLDDFMADLEKRAK